MILTFEEHQECYEIASHVVENFYNEFIAHHYNSPKHLITHWHFISYCENKLNFMFTPYDFSGISKSIGGKIDILNDIVIVTFDTNSSKVRQIFTCLHEVFHYIGHFLKGEIGQSFIEIFTSKDISRHDLMLEQQANFGASLMQINNEALLHCLYKNKSFSDICIQYSISHAAFHKRLSSYLIFEKEITQNKSNQLINKYRYNGSNKELLQYLFGKKKA